MGMLEDQKIQQEPVSPAISEGYNEERAAANPEYQGAPDTESPAETPQTDTLQAEDAAEAGMPGEEEGLGGNEEAASPEEQAEYERVMNAIGEAVYGNESTAKAILKMISQENKVGGVAQASLLLISQMDQKLDMDEVVVPQVTGDTVEMVIDLAQEGKGLQFSETEAQQALATAWEGVMELFGVDEEDYMELASGLSQEDAAGYQKLYEDTLNGS